MFAFHLGSFSVYHIRYKFFLVTLDDGVEQVVEESVRLGIGSVDTDARVQVLHTGLNDIEQSGAEGSLQVLCLVQDFTGQIFLEERLAVVGSLQLGEASFQFLLNGSINHFEIFCGPARNTEEHGYRKKYLAWARYFLRSDLH